MPAPLPCPAAKRTQGKLGGGGGEGAWGIRAKPEPEEGGKATAQGRGDDPWLNAATSACKPNISVLLQVSEQSPGQPVSLQKAGADRAGKSSSPTWDGSRKLLPGAGRSGGTGRMKGRGPLSQLREEQRWEISLTSHPGEKQPPAEERPR